MEEITVSKSHLNTTPMKNRQPYHKPIFQIYGTVKQLTAGGSGTQVDGSNVTKVSDRITKENIVRIGTHYLGINLYLFNYKPEYSKKYGTSRQFGVMADEVEAIMPSAVSVHPEGYKTVNYAMLGISQAS